MAQTNLLANSGFETAATIDGLPAAFGAWGGDQSEIVPAQNGITPLAGTRMLRFLHTSPGNTVEGTGADVMQWVDLAPFNAQIAAGGATFRLSASFNRLAGDATTDTQFTLTIRAYSGVPASGGAPLAESIATLTSDADPATWQAAAADLILPVGTTYAIVSMAALENVQADPFTGVEFAGHYADSASFALLESGSPAIVAQPVSAAVVPANATLTLQVSAAGAFPLSFQWRKGGSPLEGATNAFYSRHNFSAADAGSYDVVITNGAGAATSTATAVTLAPALGVLASDPSFTRPDFKQDARAGRVTVDTTGRVYATWTNAGFVSGVGQQLRGAVIRLNADGTLDPSFAIGPALVDAWAVALQADGKILVGGVASNESGETGLALPRVFRFNSNGTRDFAYFSPHFTATPRFMTLQPDGKLLVVASSNTSTNGGIPVMARLNSDGTLDDTFTQPVLNAGGSIFLPPVVDPDGKIYVGGIFTTINTVSRPALARLNANGTVDTSWVPSGFTVAGNGQVRGLALQTQGANAGKLLVAGGSITVAGSAAPTANRPVVRLTSTGAIDSTFTLVTQADAGMSPRPRLLNILADDRFYVVGASVARFLADGAVDPSYTKPAFSTEFFWMDTMPDGRVVVPPEQGATVNGNPAPTLVRFTASGAIDSTFNAPLFNREIYPGGFAILSDSKLLTWGSFDRANNTARPGLARFNLNGSLDPTFTVTGIANLRYVAFAEVGADGRILAGTRTGTNPTALTSGIARLSPDGAFDPSFTLDGQLSGRTEGMEFRLLPDNKIAAWSISPQGLVANNNFIARLTAAGAIDPSFNATGLDPFGAVYRGTNGAITSITVGAARVLAHDAAGRLIARVTTGNHPANATALNYTLVRLNPDGARDTTFAAPSVAWAASTSFPTVTDPQTNGGAPSQVPASMVSGAPFTGVVPVSGGQYLVFGLFTTLGGQPAPGLARLTATGALDPSFNVGTGAQLRYQHARTAQVSDVTVAADGRLWVTGAFDTFNGFSAPGIVRLNADGSVDPSFATDIFYRPYVGDGARVGFAPNGTVYVSGTYSRSGDAFPSAFQALVNPGMPTIAAQPAAANSALVGGSVTLSLAINGTAPFTYQWRKAGAPISGATNATFTLNPVALADAGIYDVVVSNLAGSAVSSPAMLSVSTSVAVHDQPFSRRVVAGNKALFRVTASTTIGGATLTYQWKKNGGNLSGATAADLVLPVVNTNDVGTYTVEISDGSGSTTGGPAQLAVLPADPVLWQSFTEFATEQAPARTLHDGAGKVYVPWSVFDRNPDMAGGRVLGALVRFHETDGTIDPSFRLDRRFRSASHAVLDGDGRLLVAVGVGDANTVVRVNHTGAIDPTAPFQAPLFARSIRFITRQADGKVIVVAADNLDANAPAGALATSPSIVRLNADGTLDSGFAAVTVTNGVVFGPPVVDSTGRIYLAGSFNQLNGVARLGVARLTSSGALDNSFPTGLPAGFTYSQIRAVALQSGDRPVFVGDFFATGIGSSSDRAMAFRFTSAGAYDTSFTPPLRTQLGLVNNRLRHLVVLSDDTIVSVSDRLVRLTANGAVDPSFVRRAFGKESFWVSQGAHGRLFVADQISVAGAAGTLPTWGNGLAVFTADGLPDFAFQTGGWGRSAVVDTAHVLSDGRVWVGGNFNRFGASATPGVALFAPDGALAATQFASARTMSFGSVVDAGSDKVFVFSNGPTNTSETLAPSLVRVTSGAVPDTGFTAVLPAGYPLSSANIAPAPGGKVLLTQESIRAIDVLNGATGDALFRLNADGSRDAGFNAALGAFASIERGAANAITMIRTGGVGVGQVLADGRLLVGAAAIDGTVRLARLLDNGAVDAGFNPPSFGTIQPSTGFTSVLTDPVTSTSAQFPISTYNSGELLRAVHQTAAGKVYVGGRFALAGTPRGLVRLNADGTVDNTFSGAGIAHSRPEAGAYVSAITSDSLGRVYIAGRFDSFNGTPVPAGLCRLKADGTFDAAWISPIAVVDAPRVEVQLIAVGAKLYAFGTVALAGDTLPAPYRIADIPPPPSITTAPVAASAALGAPAAFSVVAGGTGPFTYQWFKNGAPISGATASSYAITALTASDPGDYSVAIYGPGGTTISPTAALVRLTGPSITLPPQSQAVGEGQPFTLHVGVGGTPPFTYQWLKDGAQIGGATGASYAVASAVAGAGGSAGVYSVIATNAIGSATSAGATVTVIGAGITATHAVAGSGYVAGGTVTLTNTLTYSGTASALGWQVLLPAGWGFASDAGAAGDVKPLPGQTDLIEWGWTTPPASPVTFTYTLNVPANATGNQPLVALMILRQGGPVLQILARPDPLMVSPVTIHTADTDQNLRLNLTELTRVIELYNTRNGTNRTGAYKIDAAGEDGFNPEPNRLGSTVVALAKHHTADTDRNGRLNLLELTRVIELYNTRAGTTRTGAYHARREGEPASEDGFNPGP